MDKLSAENAVEKKRKKWKLCFYVHRLVYFCLWNVKSLVEFLFSVEANFPPFPVERRCLVEEKTVKRQGKAVESLLKKIGVRFFHR